MLRCAGKKKKGKRKENLFAPSKKHKSNGTEEFRLLCAWWCCAWVDGTIFYSLKSQLRDGMMEPFNRIEFDLQRWNLMQRTRKSGRSFEEIHAKEIFFRLFFYQRSFIVTAAAFRLFVDCEVFLLPLGAWRERKIKCVDSTFAIWGHVTHPSNCTHFAKSIIGAGAGCGSMNEDFPSRIFGVGRWNGFCHN